MFERQRRIPLLRMAWRNTRRHTRRTVLTASAITVAVAALTYGFAHITGLLGDMVDAYAKTESGHVRIRAAGYTERERMLPVHLNVRGLSTLLPVIRGHPGVQGAVPRIRAAVLVDGAASNKPGLLLGVDLEREEAYLGPSATLVAGRLPRPGHAEVLIGKPFAEKLEVAVGDSITVLTQTAYRSLGGMRLAVAGFAVTGVPYLDNAILLTPLDQAQVLTDLPDAATEILVFADDPDQADPLAASLREELQPLAAGDLEVLSWRDQGPLIRTIQMMRPVMFVIFGLLFLMASLIIVNTMLMTVMERTREFGMQAALGMRRSDIVTLIVAEGLTIGACGAAVGAALGTAVAVWLEATGINMGAAANAVGGLPFHQVLYPDWRLAFTFYGAAIGLVTAGLAALYPAWRAIRLTPAEALRT
jgi:putative ABC transport system permease protein